MKPMGGEPPAYGSSADPASPQGSSGPGDPNQGNRGRRRRRGRRWRRGRDRGANPGGAPSNAPASSNGGATAGAPMPSAGGAPAFRERPREIPPVATYEAKGVLELMPDGGGYLRQPSRNYRPSPEDVFVPRELLAPYAPNAPVPNGGGIEGIEIEGLASGAARPQAPAPEEPRGGRHHRGHGHHRGGGGGGARGPRLCEIRTINGMVPADFAQRRPFSTLTSIDPFERIRLETEPQEISTRVIDMLTPIGKGQRCLVVAPPRAGKTTLLQKIASAISRNHPEIHLIVLLVDERPEEVTDMKRNVNGEVIASSSDEMARNHLQVAEIALERAKRLVETGRDVVVLLDSITRLSRAYNNEQKGSGRVLTGGINARTMEKPRRFFGTARKTISEGSLTVIGTT